MLNKISDEALARRRRLGRYVPIPELIERLKS